MRAVPKSGDTGDVSGFIVSRNCQDVALAPSIPGLRLKHGPCSRTLSKLVACTMPCETTYEIGLGIYIRKWEYTTQMRPNEI